MADIVKAVKNELTLEKVLSTAMRTPGVKINRGKFLKKELIRYRDEETIANAVKSNPAKAGISKEIINKVSKQVVDFETTKVTGISVAASLPGGIAAVGAAAADITSYFAFILRTVQELAYLYGFEQFDFKEDDMDSETMNYVMVFVGVRMTKQIFADGVASAVPILGGALSGGLTYAMFKPGCMKLRKNLMSYNLCDPDYYKTIDAEFVEITDESAEE